MTLFERIKKVSAERGFALTEVARRADIGEKSIYAWKPSKNYPDGITPRRETLEKVADVLHVSPDYLLGNTNNPNPAPKNGKPKAVDLADRDVPMTFEGRPVSDEDRAIFEAILRRHDADER